MLRSVTDFLDAYLRISEVADFPNALNGLQLENDGKVTRIAAAVDASEATLRLAVESQSDFLLVHHGLFWEGLSRIAGPQYRRLYLALKNNLAVYSAHLPLDLHPVLGNNALLARAIGLEGLEPFFFELGQALGFAATVDLGRAELMQRLEAALGRAVWVCGAGPERVRRVGVVTGGAGKSVAKAASEGVDTFITGEGPHSSFSLAEELGINLIYGGHYATETFGVRALAKKLSEHFGIPWLFLDHPSGL
jgi:dinuclear metal center YbgI/SA1388 family protein